MPEDSLWSIVFILAYVRVVSYVHGEGMGGITNKKSTLLTVQLDQGRLGGLVQQLCRDLLVQVTGAIHALDSSDRDVGIAPLAGLGHSRGIGIVGLGCVNISVADLLLSAA